MDDKLINKTTRLYYIVMPYAQSIYVNKTEKNIFDTKHEPTNVPFETIKIGIRILFPMLY